jgi:hypothetical protein
MAADEGPMTASPQLGRVVLRLVVGSLLVAGAAACVALLGGGSATSTGRSSRRRPCSRS